MIKPWAWAVNIIVLILLLSSIGVIYKLTFVEESFMLNCSSELVNRNQANDNGAGAQHYLLVDLVAKGDRAQINYRYFNLDGSNAGNISMQGKVTSADKKSNIYKVSVKTKQESPKGEMPQHMQYLSYVSSLNLNAKGMHNLSLELLDIDQAKDYAVVLFQPSNTVCGCRLVH